MMAWHLFSADLSFKPMVVKIFDALLLHLGKCIYIYMCVCLCMCMDVTTDVWLTQCFLCFKCCMGRWISLKSVTDAGLNGHHINAMYLSRVKHWGKFIGRICFSFYRAQEQRKVYEHSIQIFTSCVTAVL